MRTGSNKIIILHRMFRTLVSRCSKSTTQTLHRTIYCPLPRWPGEVDTVIYHKECPDGFGAAYAAWKLLGNKSVSYLPRSHGNEPPAVSGKNVAIVDFSFRRSHMDEMLATAKTLILLDHHKSAADSLGDMRNCKFDMKRSGAVLSWNYFHPNKPVPKFLQHIQDNDLWLFKMPKTAEFAAALSLTDFSFEEYDKMLSADRLEEMYREGATVMRYDQRNIRLLLKDVAFGLFEGQKTVFVNTAHAVSITGNDLLTRFADIDVALCWRYSIRSNMNYISLRSRSDGVDVAALASKYGGGGHVSAAGLRFAGNITELFTPLPMATTA